MNKPCGQWSIMQLQLPSVFLSNLLIHQLVTFIIFTFCWGWHNHFWKIWCTGLERMRGVRSRGHTTNLYTFILISPSISLTHAHHSLHFIVLYVFLKISAVIGSIKCVWNEHYSKYRWKSTLAGNTYQLRSQFWWIYDSKLIPQTSSSSINVH